MEKITFCIPSKSNLRYLKTCIPSIRKNAHRSDHEIIIFVDEDEDGTIDWLTQVKDEYQLQYYENPNLGKYLYGIGMAYDFCIEKSTTDIFMIFHADMMLGKNADLYAYSHLKPKTVICSTRIEPPLHPNAGEKILKDFGMYPEEFKEIDFDKYVESNSKSDKVTNGIFAPWMMYKSEFLELGGHDAMMHSCREDSDIFNRMLLGGFNFIQPWNSLVYHLTGRGAGSFDGDVNRHENWKRQMDNSTREFIRKWGSVVKHTPLMKPIVPPKYDIEFKVLNGNEKLLNMLEPWCNRINIDISKELIDGYIKLEQPNTQFNLTDRINVEYESDIIVTFDANQLTQNAFNLITEFASILESSEIEVGEFELDIFKFTVNKIKTYENSLIQLN